VVSIIIESYRGSNRMSEQKPELQVQKEFTVQVMSDGSVAVKYPEGQPDIPPRELESITRYVYENLYETRIAQHAIQLFKQRL
jgi:hypothetical protein